MVTWANVAEYGNCTVNKGISNFPGTCLFG